MMLHHRCALLALAMFGCAAPKSNPRHVSFIESEYAPYRAEGTGSVLGQAFMRTRSGDVKYGAGCTVTLNPVTSYSTEWFDRAVLNQEWIEDGDARAGAYARTTLADGEGRFRFDRLPAGEYFVVCPVVWEYVDATMQPAVVLPTGGMAYARATVRDGESVNVVVTR